MQSILKDLKSNRNRAEQGIKQQQRSIELCSERITQLMGKMDEYDRAIELLEKDGK